MKEVRRVYEDYLKTTRKENRGRRRGIGRDFALYARGQVVRVEKIKRRKRYMTSFLTSHFSND